MAKNYINQPSSYFCVQNGLQMCNTFRTEWYKHTINMLLNN